MMLQDFNPLFSANAQTLKPSAIQLIHKLLEAPGIRSLAGAWPDPAVFPAREIGESVRRLLAAPGGSVLQYGSTRGQLELREVLAENLRQSEGFDCRPERILITSGSAQGLDLACRTFIDPGDVVLVGLPSYFGGTGTIASHGGRNVGILVDDDGIRVDLMEDKLIALQRQGSSVKGVYLIPNFQNPAGVTLSLDRREKLIELAERRRLLIFEDDPYGELRFEGEHLPSLLALDQAGCVVHFRSTSKTFVPGMRIAWVAGHGAVIDKMEIFKQCTDIATNTLAQFVLLDLIKTGVLARGIEKNRAHYRRKRDLMLRLVEQHFPPQLSWTNPAGGFFIFVTLPESLDGDELLTEALEHQVAFVSGSAFFVDGSGKNSFRLSYSQASCEDIEAAIPTLAALIKRRVGP
jgi:2-aminoadipate transaminase